MSRVMKTVPLVALWFLTIAVPPVWANWAQDGVALCTATGNQQFPTIISDDTGGAIVTWRDFRSGNLDVYAQRVNASGAAQWATDGVALCTATGDQWDPRIISDGAGGAIVTWWDKRSGTGDIYAQRVNGLGTVQWTTDGVALCTATGNQVVPTITSDGAGGAIVAWSDSRSVDGDIYAQRVNASGTVQWANDGVALCTATGSQGPTAITSDGAGGAIVTWYDGRSGSWIDDIYAQRVNGSGVAQWTTDGVALCTATGQQVTPWITSDGVGGAIVTWLDFRSGINWDIYAQRVNGSGAAQWATDGVALCTATGGQFVDGIVSDGVDGAIVTWSDERSGSLDVYAQRVNASGVVQWTTDGVALCTATGHQRGGIISDGVGGAIAAWRDYRSGNPDIYAQRVNGSGAVQWATDGVVLCTSTGDPYYRPTITSDGWSGAIVTWQDYRSGNDDIYAQRVDANGFVPLTAADGPAVPIELHQNYPNPFNPATTVTYSVPEKCSVALEIFDVSGTCIARLVDRQQEKGSYAVDWNGKDEDGNSVASGIYLYRLIAGNQTISKKMVLLK